MDHIKKLRERALALSACDYENCIYPLGKMREILLPEQDAAGDAADDVVLVAEEVALTFEACAAGMENLLARFPADKDGEPCLLGDKVWLRGREMRVVAASHKGKVGLRDWGRSGGDGAVWHEARKVSHHPPSELDALEYDLEDLLATAVSTSKGQPELVGEDVAERMRGCVRKAYALGLGKL